MTIKGGFFNNPNKTYYFIAGLPRSGSSVLSGILNQNPNFYSGPSSPVLSTMSSLENHFNNDELYLAYPKPKQVFKIISELLPNYYEDVDSSVIFDKNRAWPDRIQSIEGYFNIKAKIICPVRDYSEILTSFITLIRKNPYEPGQLKINCIDEQLVKLNIPLSDDNRCQFIASARGILGQSSAVISQAIEQKFSNRLHFVEYKDLIDSPVTTLKSLYEFIDQDYYEHDFCTIRNVNREKDLDVYGLKDMHEVRPKLEANSPKPEDILSQDILEKCKNTDFWRQIK
jgi:sulfotransferase